MRHGILGTASLVPALVVASWVGGCAPPDDAAPLPTQPAVVLDLTSRLSTPTTSASPAAPSPQLPDHLVEAEEPEPSVPATITPQTTVAPPTTVAAPDAPVDDSPPSAAVPEPDTAVAPAPGDVPSFVREMNGLRAAHGLASLDRRADLDSLAQSWATRMAVDGDLRHSDLIYDVIGGSWTTAGENIGYGPSAPAIFDALETSPGHRDNMLNPDFTSVGIGVVRVGTTLWTAHLFAG